MPLVGLAAALVLLAGCVSLPADEGVVPAPVVAAAPDPKAPRLSPLDTRTVSIAQGQELVGETQVLFARYENTFTAIGRRFDVGYEEMRAANPGVDQWLPGEATPIYLPTQSVLPDAPREGIVINVPAMRLYLFHGREWRVGDGETARGQGYESSGRDRRAGLGDADRRREGCTEGPRSGLVCARVGA